MRVLLASSLTLLLGVPFAGLTAFYLYILISIAVGIALYFGKAEPLRNKVLLLGGLFMNAAWVGAIYVATVSSLQGDFWKSGVPWALSLLVLPTALFGFSTRIEKSSRGKRSNRAA